MLPMFRRRPCRRVGCGRAADACYPRKRAAECRRGDGWPLRSFPVLHWISQRPAAEKSNAKPEMSEVAIHHLDDTQPHAFWDNTHPPRVRIQPGDTVVFETLEASSRQIT